MQAQAKAVAAAVPGATLTETSAVARVTLVLGSQRRAGEGAGRATGGSQLPASTASVTPRVQRNRPTTAPTANAVNAANCIN